jgi:CRISPR-associated protein Csx10
MRSLALRLLVRSPLAIRADHASGGAANVKAISGTTLLGGLASLYRLLYRDKPEMGAFAPLFLHNEVCYPLLYPALFTSKKKSDQSEDLAGQTNVHVYPLPVTASSCKRHPGFLFPNDSENDGHGARDTLIDWGLFKLLSADESLRQQVAPAAIFHAAEKCLVCGEAMDHFEGYYRRNRNVAHQLIAARTRTRLQTHTGIDRASGTVQDSILYNRQVFEEGMEFWGELLFPEDEQLFAQFAAFIKLIGSQEMLYLGTGRTRGMGKVSITMEAPDEHDRFDAFIKRLSGFNQAIQARAAEFQLKHLPERYFFSLTLHSPLLLLDDLLRYQSCLDDETLQVMLAPHMLPDLQLLYHASALKRITGWSEIWGTPRAQEYAIDTGSVFLFTCSSPPDNGSLRALFDLEEQGIGKRRAEGFGRVRVCDQFHQQVQQEVVA